MLFDTHAHLDQPEFEESIEKVVHRAFEAGVTDVVAVGTTADSSADCLDLAQRFDGVHAAVGIQPNSVAEAEEGDWDQIVRMADRPGVVALGETGLDRYWDFTPFDLQKDYFDRHLRLSQQTGLPFVVHMRECEADILRMLSEAAARGPLRGVMHSFTGDAAMAEECVALGLYISFAGMVTFKKSDDLRSVAAGVPDDRIVVETDSPYLSPEPLRGKKPNEPARVVHTAACLAEVRGVSPERFAEQTTDNARRLFRLTH